MYVSGLRNGGQDGYGSQIILLIEVIMPTMPIEGACEQSQKRFLSLVMKILNTTTNEHTSSVFIEYQDNKQ